MLDFVGRGSRGATLFRVAQVAVLASAGSLLRAPPSAAAIDNQQSYYLSSGLGSSPIEFDGGTLRINSSPITQNFTLDNVSGNTVDEFGFNTVMSGVMSSGSACTTAATQLCGITFTDSKGGGVVTLTGVNTYVGPTVINSGAQVDLSGAGSIADSNGVTDNGVFDISAATSAVSIESLSGSGNVLLGSQILNFQNGSSTGAFSGVISGSGGLTFSSGEEILTGSNTYTGGTTITSGIMQLGNGGTSGSILGNIANNGQLIFDRSDAITIGNAITGSGSVTQAGSGVLTFNTNEVYIGQTNINAGTLALSGSGSIASSSNVADNGNFDISGVTSGSSVKSLSGGGTVNLGNQTLTVTNGSATFSGVISGSGALVISGGTEALSGTNTYTGGTTIMSGGTLQLGGGGTTGSVVGNIVDNGTLAFNYSSGTFDALISGTGGVKETGTGITTLTAVESYTGLTTIASGTLALSGSASIASSSGVADNGTFDISGTTSPVSITSLSGSGKVLLGVQSLELTSASGGFSGVISGAGGLTVDSGTETLSGANTYTGTTSIASGATLALSQTGSLNSSAVSDNGTFDLSAVTSQVTSIETLSGSGKVNLGSKTLDLLNANDTFSGVISGNGGLGIGNGTETLTGVNTYIGTTTIEGVLKLAGTGSIASSANVVDTGTLDISGAAGSVSIQTLSGSGAVLLGSNALDLTAANGTFSGVISGSGSFTVSGQTETLSGTNTYTGGTTIASGATLQLGTGGTTGTIAGNVDDEGRLVFDYSTGSFAGVISGAGSVVQSGSGTTVLTGNETYSGGTTISKGTLQLGAGGTSGSILGNITDNGTLAVDRSDAVTLSGAISGTGGVEQIGSGTLTLAAADSYSGTTEIDSGSLALSSTGSITNSRVIDDSIFDISQTSGASIKSLSGSGSVNLGSADLTLINASDTFSGTLAGSGGLSVAGTTETLSGDNTYTGATSVQSGSLIVNGTIASSSGVTVSSGGTLAGTGSVSSTVVKTGGTLAPGDGNAGTLIVDGSVSFANGSNYIVTVSSAAASKLVASGTASLDGTLSVTSIGGDPVGQKLVVLTAAGGVSGSFDLASTMSPGGSFSYSLSQDANNVYLEVDLANLASLLPVGATTNERSVAGGIDAAITNGDTLPSDFENLGNLSGTDLEAATAQLSGEVAADLPDAASALTKPFLNAMLNDAGSAQSPRDERAWAQIEQFAAWGSVYGDAISLSADSTGTGTHSARTDGAGFIGGLRWNTSRDLSLGAAVSVGHATVQLSQSLGKGEDTAVLLGLYGFYRLSDHLYSSFATSFGIDNISISRTVAVSGNEHLTGSTSGESIAGRFETGTRLGWGLTPYVGIQGQWFHLPGFEEQSSGTGNFALSYGSQTASDARVDLGLAEGGTLGVWEEGTLNLGGRIALAHDIISRREVIATFESLSDSQFTVMGAQPANNAALLSLNSTYRGSEGMGIKLQFDTEISSRSQAYAATGGVQFQW